MVHSNVQFDVAGMAVCDCAFGCRCMCEFDTHVVSFLSFHLMRIQMDMDRRHHDVVKFCHEILTAGESRRSLVPTLDTFFHRLA